MKYDKTCPICGALRPHPKRAVVKARRMLLDTPEAVRAYVRTL